jgi:hypothetical protein
MRERERLKERERENEFWKGDGEAWGVHSRFLGFFW